MVKTAHAIDLVLQEIIRATGPFCADTHWSRQHFRCLKGNAMLVSFFSTAMLALESCEVINLRLAKLMFGGQDAHDEAHLMVSEKINAMFEATASVAAGGTASRVVDRYREHVAANVKRLSR